MSKGLKAIEIAAGVIALVIVLGIAFNLLRKGQDSFSASNAELTNSLSSMTSGQYDSYNGTS